MDTTIQNNAAFQPGKIGNLELKNRLIVPAMVTNTCTADGLPTERFMQYHEEKARGGWGLIITEDYAVTPYAGGFRELPGLWSDEQIEGHRRLVQACHPFDVLIMPQLHYGGLGTHPECGPLTSPSAVTWHVFGKEVQAVELTVSEIHRIEQCFIDAAVRAKAAGYDGVQLHGCHRYLINDFASRVNQRRDAYGGSTENRARFGCEIIEGIRRACGEDFIISMRTSGFDPTLEESLGIAEGYVEAGCDYLQVSNGIEDIAQLPFDETLPYNRVASLGVAFHEHFRGRVPVSAVSGIHTPELARYLLEHELVDTVDLARGLLADPALADAVLRGTPYSKCAGCKSCGWGPLHAHRCPALDRRKNEEWIW